MQEIAPQIYIETGFPGVTLGAINWSHGLVLIDSPFRLEDTRLWRAALQNLGGGVDRLLVNLDAHFDRTLGARAMECTIVGHEKMAQVFRNRPVNFKVQASISGGEWELYNGMGSIRWAPPEITFTDQLQITWTGAPLSLEYHPGPATGSIWAVLPEQQVIFLGDAVIPDQPPFLVSADLPVWIDSLQALFTPAYANYLLVSGRSGLVVQAQVKAQIAYLERLNQRLEALSASKAGPMDIESLVPEFIADFKASPDRQVLFEQRLRWGLSHYYARHYHIGTTENIDE
jgi:glyoxylase-like metal-dependent hydrolase (beta-lactamase superfamily II)